MSAPARPLCLAAALALAACSGADPETGAGPPAAGGGAVSPFCADARLAAANATPLAELAIHGLAPTLAERPIDELFALYVPEGSGDEIPVPVRMSEDGDAALIVPPHPAGIGGGAGTLRLTDGKRLGCPALTLTVAPIAPAPGTTARIADQLGELIRARTRAYGFDPERLLAAAAEDLPLVVLPQAMALWGLEGDGGAPSLRAALERGAVEPMVDALLAHASIPQRLEAEIAAVEAWAEPAPWASIASRTGGIRGAASSEPRGGLPLGGLWAWSTVAVAADAQPPRSYTRRVIDIPPVTITSAAELSRYMRRQAAAAGTLGKPTGKLFHDATGEVVSLIGIWAPGVGAVAGAVHWVYLKTVESDRQLLPCCFRSIEYELERPRFEEDFEFPPEHANWRRVKVVAHNLGWNLSQTALEAAEQTIGLGKGFQSAHRNYATRKAGGRVDVDPFGEIVGTPEGKWRSKAEGWAKSKFELDSLTVPPYTWPPIDVTHAQWSRGEAEGAIRTVSTHGYAPAAVGGGKLTVETLRGRFGNAHKALAKPVEVREISVAITPKVQRVEPGDRVELRAFVRDSVHPEQLEWRFVTARGVELGSFTSTHAGGEHRATIALPRDETAFPITVEAESTSRTGLRASGTPRRFGSATLTAGVVVEVGPQPACVEPGDPPLPMWAEVVGADDATVTWRVVSGPAGIDRRSGELVARSRGEAKVRATSVADPRAWGEATVELGICHCTVSGTISGDTTKTAVLGNVAHFSTSGAATVRGAFSNPEMLDAVSEMLGGAFEGERAESWRQEMAAMPRETLGISLVGAEAEGEALIAAMAGGFKLQASVGGPPIEPGFAGGLPLEHLAVVPGDWTEGAEQQVRYEWLPGAPGSAHLTVSQYTGRALQGTIAGNLFGQGVYKPGGAPPQISFVVHFRALEFDPLNQKLGCVVAD